MIERLEGTRLILRKPRLSDADAIELQVGHPEIARWTVRIPHPYPKGGGARFIRRVIYQWRTGREYVFAIVRRDTHEPVGLVGLANVSREHGCAELGYWIGVDHWGQGYGTEAVRLALEVAFRELRLHRVYASTFDANTASRRVLQKNGFQLEGRMREAVLRSGRRHDFLNFGLLGQEFAVDKPIPRPPTV